MLRIEADNQITSLRAGDATTVDLIKWLSGGPAAKH